MAKKTKTAKREKARERRERRFEPQASTKPRVVYMVGAVGRDRDGRGRLGAVRAAPRTRAAPEPLKVAPYILAAGALLVGVAIWIGTSGEPALRVGDAGLAVEKGGVRRMPWYAIERIEWRDEDGARDGEGRRRHRDDPRRVARRATPRRPRGSSRRRASASPPSVDVPEDATLPDRERRAGESLPLEPPQVVGKHCAASGKVIAYEPDARVCPRCERVYHKAQRPRGRASAARRSPSSARRRRNEMPRAVGAPVPRSLSRPRARARKQGATVTPSRPTGQHGPRPQSGHAPKSGHGHGHGHGHGPGPGPGPVLTFLHFQRHDRFPPINTRLAGPISWRDKTS